MILPEVPLIRRPTPGAALWAALAVACGASGAPEPVPLAIEVRARAIAAGEPLRIDVSAPEPLATLSGEFLGRPLFLVRTAAAAPGEQWSAWGLVDLDQPAGRTAIDVRGTTVSGRPAAGALPVTIAERTFPEEQLTVAPQYVKPPPDVEARLARERERLSAVYGSLRPVPPSREPFRRPVPGDPTSIFGTRRIYNGEPRSPHPGLDLRAAPGTDVQAAGDGTVALAQELYYSGRTVILDHGGGLFTVYAHLSEIHVAEGQAALAGQRLGRSGATGRVTGPHLHWGAKIGDRPFDPTALLDGSLF
jgi:murein DD-endopeptidase MepM/ murein hydrolase activator NlpD